MNVRQLSDSIIWVFRGEFRGVSEAWSASFLISIHGARTGFATTQSLCSEIRRVGVDFAKDCKHMPPLASQSWCSTVIVHQNFTSLGHKPSNHFELDFCSQAVVPRGTHYQTGGILLHPRQLVDKDYCIGVKAENNMAPSSTVLLKGHAQTRAAR